LTPTAFLDRDGTINVKPPDGEYVTRPEQLLLLPRTAQAIGRLNAAGWRAILVTNQRGVALGRMDDDDLRAIHRRLESELARSGARLDAVYACPHADGACDCRKPATGLFARACADDTGIDLAQSVVIGDSWRDMDAAAALGCLGVLIADPPVPRSEAPADHVAASLWDAVDWLLAGQSAATWSVARSRDASPPR
jgi:D-glycero-D-manno-heptose 1,7-bisphosphate phosphatase